MSKEVLVLTSEYPFGSPRAFRINAFISMFIEIGFKVAVVCDCITDFRFQGCKAYEDNDIKVYTYRRNLSNKNRVFIPFVYPKEISQIIDIEKPDLVFSVSDYSKFVFTRMVCGKRRIPLVLESCEDYDHSTFKFGRFDNNYILHKLHWRFFYKKANGVVAISRLLEKHYLLSVKNVIRIPTITNVRTTPCNLRPSEKKIVLFFAGNFARGKDAIAPFVKALDGINEYERFEFKICGVTVEEVEAHLGADYFRKYKKQLNILGKIPQPQVTMEYQTADFGIFFRPLRRSSFAGFPTKLGEGMATGTPFIINDTGDIPLYVKSGENGYLANNIDEIATVYEDILQSSDDKRKSMREAARFTAENCFDFRNYKDTFRKFLNDLEE